MTKYTKPIAESKNFIILDEYTNHDKTSKGYQSENELELELIKDLVNQGFEFIELKNQGEMLGNLRIQLQKLNNIQFTGKEWNRFVADYIDKPSENATDKTRKIHIDHVCDFTFDDERLQNIYLLDKSDMCNNNMQVLSQFKQKGKHLNIYDVTILVNGLPLVHIELKRRGVAIREAFNQIHRYSKESFNREKSLYKFLQIFVISNGTDTRYFSNTVKRDKNSFDFTMNWAKLDNTRMRDLKDFTATFLQKNTLLKVLLHYSVFDVDENLLVMRPYQIAAVERILWKINSSHTANNWSKPESGGYVWHTTGSGKTLTSFKAANMATELDFIDKVIFVVDRKDLDNQTMREYKRFSPDSVNGSNNTAALKKNLDSNDNKITVTTIQKLNHLIKNENNLNVYEKQVVFIFDECHRSQFGVAQQNIKKKFKRYYQFGFTGTPIFAQNAAGTDTTAKTFGCELHSYVITDAIRDEKVLKFKVDYNNVGHKNKDSDSSPPDNQKKIDDKKLFHHPGRIEKISQYVMDNYRFKTHRREGARHRGFNALFAVDSVEAAKLYYEKISELNKSADKPLVIATIFSYAANEEQKSVGEIIDEDFNISAMDSSAKEFLDKAINDYNGHFKTSFGVENDNFQNYYQDLSKRVKAGEVDLLIVVGMFLTGFDAPGLNTLFVDKHLSYHGLIQAYSRTNRIYDATKTFGNIVTFRDLEQETIKAITLFGDENTKNVLLEKSFKEYMEGFKDVVTGNTTRGFLSVVAVLQEKFPEPSQIDKDSDKKEFVKLFNEYLRLENVLQNYDDFTSLKALQEIDINDANAVEEFKHQRHLSEDDFVALTGVKILNERAIQDYRSAYSDIKDWVRLQKQADEIEETSPVWDDVVFEVDLLKSQEINLDFILEKIFENNRNNLDKNKLIESARRLIRASVDNRAKESLLVEFIDETDLNTITDKNNLIELFYGFAQKKQKIEAQEIIESEGLDVDNARRYITVSLENGFASVYGNSLNAALPPMSPLSDGYFDKKARVFQKISDFVNKFKGVGGEI